jgi:branched-chain amino acid transport system substrate-binding protein
VTAWKAKFNRLPTDNEGQSYNAMLVMFEGVKKSGSVKPADVAKAVRGMTLETLYGPATMRAQDNQLVLPTYSARAKVADGVLRPVIEQRFDPSLTPAPSPLCKL